MSTTVTRIERLQQRIANAGSPAMAADLVRRIGAHFDPEAVGVLVTLLDDREEVAVAAARTLATYGEAAVPALSTYVARGNANSDGVHAATVALRALEFRTRLCQVGGYC